MNAQQNQDPMAYLLGTLLRGGFQQKQTNRINDLAASQLQALAAQSANDPQLQQLAQQYASSIQGQNGGFLRGMGNALSGQNTANQNAYNQQVLTMLQSLAQNGQNQALARHLSNTLGLPSNALGAQNLSSGVDVLKAMDMTATTAGNSGLPQALLNNPNIVRAGIAQTTGGGSGGPSASGPMRPNANGAYTAGVQKVDTSEIPQYLSPAALGLLEKLIGQGTDYRQNQYTQDQMNTRNTADNQTREDVAQTYAGSRLGAANITGQFGLQRQGLANEGDLAEQALQNQAAIEAAKIRGQNPYVMMMQAQQGQLPQAPAMPQIQAPPPKQIKRTSPSVKGAKVSPMSNPKNKRLYDMLGY